eukprot:353985-Chlamydomonas_euryale.AAC.7
MRHLCVAPLLVHADSSCSAAWSDVKVNGIDPVPAPLFKPYGGQAELKISFPEMPHSEAVGSVITFNLAGSCPDLVSFTGPYVSYSMAESNYNKCCP